MHEDLERAFSLSGRVAVVTGAASGIGRETALVLSRAGARVFLTDVDEAGLAEATSRIAAEQGIARNRTTDVSKREQVDKLAEDAVQEFGKIDIWVNAAGIIFRRSIMDVSEADYERLLSINLAGVYWGVAAAGRTMAGGGSIINLSSAGGESASPGISLYSMSKAALNMLTRTAAVEFGKQGIRVNAVAPGFVDTPMNKYHFVDEAGVVVPDRYAELIRIRGSISPLGLTGTPQDIALAILYLASDASRFVTGQILRPNGGVSMP